MRVRVRVRVRVRANPTSPNPYLDRLELSERCGWACDGGEVSTST